MPDSAWVRQFTVGVQKFVRPTTRSTPICSAGSMIPTTSRSSIASHIPMNQDCAKSHFINGCPWYSCCKPCYFLLHGSYGGSWPLGQVGFILHSFIIHSIRHSNIARPSGIEIGDIVENATKAQLSAKPDERQASLRYSVYLLKRLEHFEWWLNNNSVYKFPDISKTNKSFLFFVSTTVPSLTDGTYLAKETAWWCRTFLSSFFTFPMP